MKFTSVILLASVTDAVVTSKQTGTTASTNKSTNKKVTTEALHASKNTNTNVVKHDVARNIFGGKTSENSFITELKYEHKLRICNAYPYDTATGFDIYKGKNKLTDEPLQYKKCKDFDTKLSTGDKIEFKMNDNDVGAFSIQELPSSNALLFLGIYRHDAQSAAVSFTSHVFANLFNSQIALIDTYRTKSSDKNKSIIKIIDQDDVSRSEELRFDAVVAVNAGRYQVQDVKINGKEDKVVSLANFNTMNRESYVVMRVGIDDQDNKFPEEVIVFPQENSIFGAGGNAKTLLGIAGFGAVGLLGGVMML